MAAICEICGKRTAIGRQVSHSGVRTRRAFKANLQTKWFVIDGKRVKRTLCTKCIKRLRREKRLQTQTPAQA